MYSSISSLIACYKEAKQREDHLSAFLHQLSNAEVRIELKIVREGGQRDFLYEEGARTIKDELVPLAEKRLEAAKIKVKDYEKKLQLLKDVLEGINK